MPSKAREDLLYPAASHILRLFGSQGNTITLTHPDEPHLQKYGRYGEAPVPRSRTRLEEVALHNLLPHSLPCESTNPQQKFFSTNPQTKNGRREKDTEHSSEWRG